MYAFSENWCSSQVPSIRSAFAAVVVVDDDATDASVDEPYLIPLMLFVILLCSLISADGDDETYL